ncbi:MAG: hypothetical protein LBL87_05590 [Ruminococcus sp.]|jgi:hypothetical protein|nr:hypothetical protein [Ruminococcus sp.]
MIKKPIISEAFTLEDIRKIRDYNYEIVKDMTYEQYRAHLERETAPILARIEELRRERQNNFSEGVSP